MSKVIVKCSICHKEEVFETSKTDITESILTICPDCQKDMTDRNLKGWHFSVTPKKSRKKIHKKENYIVTEEKPVTKNIDESLKNIEKDSRNKIQNAVNTVLNTNTRQKIEQKTENIKSKVQTEQIIENTDSDNTGMIINPDLEGQKDGKFWFNGKQMDSDDFKDFKGSSILTMLPYTKDYLENYDFSIYAYGESDTETGIGAYSYVILRHDTKGLTKFSQGYFNTTNNRMELMAVVNALIKIPDKARVNIYSNSVYVIKVLNGEWENKSNKPLWDTLGNETINKTVDFSLMKNYRNSEILEIVSNLCKDELKRIKNENTGEKDMEFNPGQFNNISKTTSRAMSIRIYTDKNTDYKDRTVKITDFYEEIGVNKSCAEAIDKFRQKKKHTFTDYKNIKTYGNDRVSSMKMSTFYEYYQDHKEVINIVKKYLRSIKQQEAALRWHYRGLSIEDSIRKVLVDTEINEALLNKQKGEE